MCDIFFCFSSAPTDADKDPRFGNTNTWKVRMLDAPCKDPCCCLYGFLCPVCATYHGRYWAIQNDWSNYTCCQGQFSICGIPGQNCHKSCPCPYPVQMCCEACFCTGIAMSSSRNFIMQEKSLMSDPCDNKLIRFNNCLQILRCICIILAAIDSTFETAAEIVDLIAELVFRSLMGCMTAQIKYEMTDTKPAVNYNRGAPQEQVMEK